MLARSKVNDKSNNYLRCNSPQAQEKQASNMSYRREDRLRAVAVSVFQAYPTSRSLQCHYSNTAFAGEKAPKANYQGTEEGCVNAQSSDSTAPGH
jgi:hypothetical protein